MAHFDQSTNYVHLSLDSGKLMMSVITDSTDNAFIDAIEAKTTGSDFVSFAIEFSPADILDCTIENHTLINQPGQPIDIEAKPVINALKTELLAMLARIDTLKFQGES